MRFTKQVVCAKIYYADRKNEASEVLKIAKDPEKFGKRKEEVSWVAKLSPLFKVMSFIGRYRIYAPYKYHNLDLLNSYGHFFGMLGLGNSGKMKKSIKMAFKAFYPNQMSEKRLQKLTEATIKNFGALFIDFMWRLPLTPELPHNHFVKFSNLEKLDEALAQGKGVIITVSHVGDFLYPMPIFANHPNQYKVSAVARVANMGMYKSYLARPSLKNLYVYAATDFSRIKPFLIEDLKKNHIMIIYHDYSSPKQLRVPMIHEKFPYLIHTPQSAAALQRATGAVILPMISRPLGNMSKMEFHFLQNSEIMKAAEENKEKSVKEFNGAVSTEINKVLYCEIRKYPHCWEEITGFATMRIADKLVFPKHIKVQDVINLTIQKMKWIVDLSYEPKRNDDELIKIIEALEESLKISVKEPEKIFRSHKTFINLSMMSAINELKKLSEIIGSQLYSLGEIKSAMILIDSFKKF